MSAARALGLAGIILFGTLVTSGSLGDPVPKGFVTFDEVRRTAFTAVAVQREYAAPSLESHLVVRVHVIGDAADDADYSTAATWLEEHVNVRLERHASGAPLYLTRENLIATSGPSTLGATIKSGMAVEVRDDAIHPCVLAHEVLHFLGLHHVNVDENLMHPRCSAHKLDRSMLTPAQVEHVASLDSIHAVTPRGIVTWAYRVG